MQAGRYCEEIKRHPGVRIAPHLFHMALEDFDLPGVLRQQGELISYLHVSDSNQRLPGRGFLNFPAIAEALREMNYSGWLTLTCGTPGANQPNAAGIYGALPMSLAILRDAGFTQ
jgi:sugar phosphate isomerase/epimerase